MISCMTISTEKGMHKNNWSGGQELTDPNMRQQKSVADITIPFYVHEYCKSLMS